MSNDFTRVPSCRDNRTDESTLSGPLIFDNDTLRNSINTKKTVEIDLK